MESNIVQKKPFVVELEKDQAYFWCSCGKSGIQPFCDGSHKGSGMKPVRFVAEKEGKVALCGCGRSKNGYLCDGTHKSL